MLHHTSAFLVQCIISVSHASPSLPPWEGAFYHLQCHFHPLVVPSSVLNATWAPPDSTPVLDWQLAWQVGRQAGSAAAVLLHWLVFLALFLVDRLWTEKNFGFEAGFWVQRGRLFLLRVTDASPAAMEAQLARAADEKVSRFKSRGFSGWIVFECIWCFYSVAINFEPYYTYWTGPLEMWFFSSLSFCFLPGSLSSAVVEREKLRPWFRTCNIPYIRLSSKYLVASILLCWISLVHPPPTLPNHDFGKAEQLMMQASAKLQPPCVFFGCCLEMPPMARICTLSAQGCESVSRALRSCLCSSCSLCCPTLLAGGIISSASLLDLLVSHSARQRAVSLLLLRVSAAPLMFDQPKKKKQPRGLFIPHVSRAKGRRSTVTHIGVELARFDFF